MPLTTLDRVSALVVVDLQKGLLGRAPTLGPVLARTAELAHAYRERGLPVVLVTVDGTPPGRTDAGRRDLPADPSFAEPVDELAAHPDDHRVTKQAWGAFTGTDLDAWLRSRGATQIAVTGVATAMGVESTARSAHELGYHVVLVEDAMTDPDPERHAYALGKVFPALGEVTTTAELLAAIAA